MKIFLGGTCNKSTWRQVVIDKLIIDYFNPVVDNWTPECQAEELKQRIECDICLYVITPRMIRVYSIAEVVDDSNKHPDKTILCIQREFDGEKFTETQYASLHAVGKLVESNGSHVFTELDDLINYLNGLVL